MVKNFIILILLLPSFYGFSQKGDEKVMKATADKLLGFLSKNDTAAIVRLHAGFYLEDLPNEKEYKKGLDRLLEDCKTYQKITKIYGTPKRNSYTIKDGINENMALEVVLFNKKDTILNMTSCKIVIQFYPTTILSPEKIYYYDIQPGTEKPKNLKIIPAPPIRN